MAEVTNDMGIIRKSTRQKLTQGCLFRNVKHYPPGKFHISPRHTLESIMIFWFSPLVGLCGLLPWRVTWTGFDFYTLTVLGCLGLSHQIIDKSRCLAGGGENMFQVISGHFERILVITCNDFLLYDILNS